MQRVAIGLVTCVILSLAGCDGSDKNGSPAKGTIGVSVLTLRNDFFDVIGDNITAELKKHGYETIVTDGDEKVSEQRRQVQDFITKKVAAIVLCPTDAHGVAAAIQEANDAGIPVFTADLACLDKNAKVVSHIATDNMEGGRQAGHAMIETLGEAGGKIAILDKKAAESCLLRVEGFKEVIAAHNEGRESGQIEIVAELPGDGDRAKGMRAAQDALQAHPDLVGIFAINDPSALGARSALEKAGKADQVKIIGFDGQPEGKRAIRKGEIYADPIQYPDKIGKMTAETIVKYLCGEKVEPVQLIPTKLYRQADAENDPEAK